MNSKVDSSVARVAEDGRVPLRSDGSTADFEADTAAAFEDLSRETFKAKDDSKSISWEEPNFEQIL